MRSLAAVFLTCFILFCSCEKEGSPESILRARIDTTLLSTETLAISFGYFGDEEGITILYPPHHAKTFELLNEMWEERILQYIPADGFLGIDSTALVTMRGSDGAGPSTDVDTFRIMINVVKDEFHRKLIGRWNWIWSCGGFTGGCWYPGPDNHEEIEFRYDMRYIEKYNDSVVRDLSYFLIDTFMNGQSLVYEIGFENGYDTYYRFVDDELNVQGGDFWKGYERME